MSENIQLLIAKHRKGANYLLNTHKHTNKHTYTLTTEADK